MIVKCLESLYKEKPVLDDKGNIVDIKEVPVKENFVTLLDIEEEHIIAVKQHYNKNGKIYKDRCIISHSTLGNLIVKHSFEEMVKIRNNYKFCVKGLKVK